MRIFERCNIKIYLFLVLGLIPPYALSFTQSGMGLDVVGNGFPMGHEWVTRIALLELIGDDPVIKPDPNDPRKSWKKGLAKNLNLGVDGEREVKHIKEKSFNDTRYQSTFFAGYSAIVGERWVDIAGFNVAKGKAAKYDCWDAVAQEPVEIQRDHYMRRYDDNGAKGGVDAALRSQERFVQHFVAAATAKSGDIEVWDGGGYSAKVKVDHNYFLFGRAVHLFQDAFSPEHTVRIADDNYEKVRQVKSYLCATHSEQHSHNEKEVLDYKSGDVVWKPETHFDVGWQAYKPSNMKTVALVSVEASKDLWAAFIRTMAVTGNSREAKAKQEAKKLIENWLAINTSEALTWYDNESRRDATYVLGDGEKGKGMSQSDCVKKLGVKSGNQMDKVKELENAQRMCLYNIMAVKGTESLFDHNFHMPYNWQWKNKIKWLKPPEDWEIPK